MSYDLDKRRPQDATKISLTEPWEIRYWCKAIGVTEAALRAAVKAAGNGAAAVKRHLGE